VEKEKKPGALLQSIHAGHYIADAARLSEGPESDDTSPLMLSIKADSITTRECPSRSVF
jgi:hypothetical protein